LERAAVHKPDSTAGANGRFAFGAHCKIFAAAAALSSEI
jgi:hypothetical protein